MRRLEELVMYWTKCRSFRICPILPFKRLINRSKTWFIRGTMTSMMVDEATAYQSTNQFDQRDVLEILMSPPKCVLGYNDSFSFAKTNLVSPLSAATTDGSDDEDDESLVETVGSKSSDSRLRIRGSFRENVIVERTEASIHFQKGVWDLQIVQE